MLCWRRPAEQGRLSQPKAQLSQVVPVEELFTVTNTTLFLAAGSKGSLPSQLHSSWRHTVVKAIKSTLVHELCSLVLPAHLTEDSYRKLLIRERFKLQNTIIH